MKKVLIIFDGICSPENVISFLKKNAFTKDTQFHGVFINKLHTDQAYNYPFPNDLSATSVDYTFENDESETYRLIKIYIELFEDECRANDMEFKTDFFTEVSLDHLIERSGYIDLIISDRRTEFEDYSVIDILIKAYCPVLLIGQAKNKLSTAILTYDGSINSMHAIRQYSYLMPEFRNLYTTLLTINGDENIFEKQQTLVKDYLNLHFSNFSIENLTGKPEDKMVGFINKSDSTVIIMGAYGRATVSRWTRSSHADKILSNTDATVFITHMS